MLTAIETYLRLRRTTGFAMSNAEYLLKSFATFSAVRGQTHVHTQTAIDWAARGPSVAQRDARLKAICRFVRHVCVEDDRHELPSANHFGARKRRRPPHIYSAAELDRLIEAALQLRPKGLRAQTFATLIARRRVDQIESRSTNADRRDRWNATKSGCASTLQRRGNHVAEGQRSQGMELRSVARVQRGDEAIRDLRPGR